jgi:N-formylglutamate amidohydrolase
LYSRCFKEKPYTTNGIYSKLGNLPLIITAPHGGQLKPKSIHDRTRHGSLLLADMYTKEIASGIEQFLSNYYKNAAPYIIMNDIARRKADVNRSLEDGTETEAGEKVWKEYHNRVKFSVEDLLKEHGRGLLVDIHGVYYFCFFFFLFFSERLSYI